MMLLVIFSSVGLKRISSWAKLLTKLTSKSRCNDMFRFYVILACCSILCNIFTICATEATIRPTHHLKVNRIDQY